MESRSKPLGGLESLTPRERDVLGLLAERLSNKELVTRLCISRSTLQHHIAAIYAKLGCTNRAQAELYAVRHDLKKSAGPYEDSE